MEGLRPRAGQGEAAAPPDRPVSPTFRAGDEGHRFDGGRLVQAGRSPSGRSALALATPVSPTGRVSGAQFACLKPMPKGGRHDCSTHRNRRDRAAARRGDHRAAQPAQGVAEERPEGEAFGGDHRGLRRLHQGQGGVAAARGRDRAGWGGRPDRELPRHHRRGAAAGAAAARQAQGDQAHPPGARRRGRRERRPRDQSRREHHPRGHAPRRPVRGLPAAGRGEGLWAGRDRRPVRGVGPCRAPAAAARGGGAGVDGRLS